MTEESIENLSVWVAPFYLKILPLTATYDREFIDKSKEALRSITPGVVERLFEHLDWRTRLTAAWFCGLKGWTQYTDRIGGLLVDSELVLAGRGYCFALARFGDEKSAAYLTRYLGKFLDQPDKAFEQETALAALIWLDGKNKTNHAVHFLKRGGPWEQFVLARAKKSGTRRIEVAHEAFAGMMRYTAETFSSSPQ